MDPRNLFEIANGIEKARMSDGPPPTFLEKYDAAMKMLDTMTQEERKLLGERFEQSRLSKRQLYFKLLDAVVMIQRLLEDRMAYPRQQIGDTDDAIKAIVLYLIGDSYKEQLSD